MSTLILKSGTTSISGAIVKGDFSYFSASTKDLGPTSVTGLYSGIDAPDNGYTIYQIGGPDGFTIRLATNTEELNTVLIQAGATGTTVNDNITWATNTNSIFINSGTTISYYYLGGAFTYENTIIAPSVFSLNSGGTQNTSFNAGAGFNNQVNCSAIDSDGKILVGGQFTAFTGGSQNYLIRLNADGSKDTSFNIGVGFNLTIYSLAIDSNGKILVGGGFVAYSGFSENRLIRLNTDGSKDTSFNIGTGFNNAVTALAIDSNGKILVGGNFTTFTGVSQNRLVRLNTDGSKDTSFDIGTGFNNLVNSIAIDSNNKVLVGGNFTTFTGATQGYFIKLNTDGSIDTSFNTGTGFNAPIYSIKIDSNQKTLIGGAYTTYTGGSQNRLIRLNTDGTKDTSFDIGTGFGNSIFSVTTDSYGNIVVGGQFNTFTGVTQNNIIRLNTDGSKDTSFNIGNGFNNTILTISINSTGEIFTGGQFAFYSGVSKNYFTKYTSRGLVDTSFNIGTGFDNLVYTTSIDSNGKIIVGGQFSTFTGATQNRLIRLNTNGSKDTSFNVETGFNNIVYTTTIDSNEKILVGGNFTTFTGASQNYLIRLNTDGSKDTLFNIGTGFNNTVYSVVVDSNNKVLVGGNFTTFTGASQNYLIRLNSDGSKDTSFNIGTGFNAQITALAIDSNGKILVGGSFTTFTGVSQNRLVRLNSDGSKDTSFNIGTGFNGLISSIVINSDQKILAGGNFTTFTGGSQTRLIRLNTDGSKDTSLTVGNGFGSIVNSVAIDKSGIILVGGSFNTYNSLKTVLYNATLNTDGSLSTPQITFNNTINYIKTI